MYKDFLVSGPSKSLFNSSFLTSKFIVLDGNLSYYTYKSIFASQRPEDCLIWFEPTSVPKCVEILPYLDHVDFISPNEMELNNLILELTRGNKEKRVEIGEIEDMASNEKMEILIRKMMINKSHSSSKHIFLTKGSDGIDWMSCTPETNFDSILKELKPSFQVMNDQDQSINVSGAGDAFVGGMVFAMNSLLVQNSSSLIPLSDEQIEECIHFGMEIAFESCKFKETVPPFYSDTISDQIKKLTNKK